MKNNNDNSWQGMLVIFILGLFGVLMLFFTGFFSISTYNDLYVYISNYGMGLIFSLFFIGVEIYCCVIYFRNVFFKPKRVILYSFMVEDGVVTFIDKKGKKFLFSSCQIDVGKYYCVLKTYDHIKEILSESSETFILPKEKKSYWLNMYLPIGKFENILLLPVVYVIFIPGLLSIIMSSGYQKIYGIIYSLVPCYVIIYDLIYKIKLNNSDGFGIDDSKMVNSYLIFINSIKVLFVIILNIILINIYINSFDIISKFVLLPFCLCGLWSFLYVVSKIVNNNRIVNFFVKGYVIIFLLFLVGLLIYFTVGMIKTGVNVRLILFLILFLFVLIYVFYKFFIKRK